MNGGAGPQPPLLLLRLDSDMCTCRVPIHRLAATFYIPISYMVKTVEPAATEEEEETPGDWDFLTYEWKALKFESIHLFQDEDELIPTSNLALSLIFYVCAVLAFVLLTTMYRCEAIENQVGVQKIDKVGDCDNLLTVTCLDTCGEIYGPRIGAVVNDYYSPSNYNLYIMPTQFDPYGSLMVTTGSPGFERQSCVLGPQDTRGYFIFTFTTQSWEIDVFSATIEECTNLCSQFSVGSTIGRESGCCPINYAYEMINSIDCSCNSLQPCGCDAYVGNSGADRRVTNTPTCKAYLELKDTQFSDAFPIAQCDGILREVIECKDFITLIGTFGGYVSLLYSATGVLFFILLSRAKFFKKGRKKKSDEDPEQELQMTSVDLHQSNENSTMIIL